MRDVIRVLRAERESAWAESHGAVAVSCAKSSPDSAARREDVGAVLFRIVGWVNHMVMACKTTALPAFSIASDHWG